MYRKLQVGLLKRFPADINLIFAYFLNPARHKIVTNLARMICS